MLRLNWKRSICLWSAGTLAACSIGAAGNAADLKEAAPNDSFIAVYHKHNPERDYMKSHYQEVWKTIQQTRLLDRSLQIIQNQIGEADAKQFIAVREALTTALAPVEWEKLGQTTELMFAQRMQAPASQQLVLVRIPDGGAASLSQGIVNLFNLAEQSSGGKVTVSTQTVSGIELKSLNLGNGVPMQPLVGASGDLFVFATSLEFATTGLELLDNPDAVSKFDDPRCVEALSKLPAAEDSVVFFDAKAMMGQMKSLSGFVKQVSGNNPKAAQVADLLESTLDQFDGLDYEITVEYTEGFQNRQRTLGRIQEGVDKKVLGRMMADQQAFADWTKWVPASANGFSLSSGVNLHPVYEWIVTEVPAAFPETEAGFDRFAALQDQYDLHLDQDLLTAFGGESVTLSFPGPQTAFGKSNASVFFARCEKPERIQELIHRGFNALLEIPQIKAQGIGLKDVPGMEGFEEITANMMAMAGVRPVIGFHDGWMVIGSSPDAVQKALQTQAGEGDTFAASEVFHQFELDVNGPVSAISFQNIGESLRQTSQGLQQAGMMLPMFIGMAAGQNQNGPDLRIIQEIAGLLPAAGQIIGKFDFLDQQMSVTQTGAEEGTYIRDKVLLIRPPAAVETSAESTN